MVETCQTQLDTADTWTGNFGLDEAFALLDEDMPFVSAAADDTSFDVADGIQALRILIELSSAVKYASSGYYYLLLGKSIGSAIGNSVAGADSWFQLGLITP